MRPLCCCRYDWESIVALHRSDLIPSFFEHLENTVGSLSVVPKEQAGIHSHLLPNLPAFAPFIQRVRECLVHCINDACKSQLVSNCYGCSACARMSYARCTASNMTADPSSLVRGCQRLEPAPLGSRPGNTSCRVGLRQQNLMRHFTRRFCSTPACDSLVLWRYFNISMHGAADMPADAAVLLLILMAGGVLTWPM